MIFVAERKILPHATIFLETSKTSEVFMWGELADSFQHGNGYLIGILIIGFFATVIFFERLIMLQFVYHIDFNKFLTNLKKMVQAEDLNRAMNLCKNVSPTALPKISLKALEAAEVDPLTIRSRIEEEAVEFLPNIEKRLGIIPAATILIMMIGLLGTIDSLWNAFQSVDVLDTARKQANLAEGIAGALNPTALGLIFCMVLLAGHQMLRGMALNLTEKMHHGIVVLTNLLCPQEALTYMPMSQPSQENYAHHTKSNATNIVEQPAAALAAGIHEPFDDVTVEDIKDEEEII